MTTNTIDSSKNSGIVLSPATYADPLTITNTGTVVDPSSDAISSQDAWTIENAGSIYGGRVGVDLMAGGTVINSGSIAGKYYGIELHADGAVSNQAGGSISAIAGLAGTATIVNQSGGTIGFVQLNTGGTVDNQAGGYIHGLGNGIDASASTTVENAGTIKAQGYGILIENGSGDVDNSGTLQAGMYGVFFVRSSGEVTNTGFIDGKTGVFQFGTTETLENAGTILGSGSYAAFLEGTVSNLLILDPGAVFDGQVYSTAHSATNTIELTSGAAAGTLSGLGSKYLHFQTVTIDSGATWNITGKVDAFATTAIDGFDAAHDRLDLTDLTFSAADTVTLNGSNQLIIDDAGGNITIQMDSAVTGGQLVLVDDGRGGTLVERPPTFQISGSVGGINLASDNYGDPLTITQTGTVGGEIGGNRPWTIVNQGLINGAAIQYELALPGGSIDNSGTIIGGGFGMFLTGVATVDNSGFVGGAGGKYAFGGALYGGGDFINEAAGTVGNEGAVIDDGFGVVVRGASGTIDNAGTIAGNLAAIYFGATDSHLIVHPGAVFDGAVAAGGVVATSTIELASGAVAGTLSGLGSEYTGFRTVTIDSGATWDIAGTVAAFATTAIDGFSAYNTLDLTDLAFNAADTATLNDSNQLVIDDAGGNVTIQMDVAVAGGQFTLVSDGHGGTFVERLFTSQISGTVTSGVTLTSASFANPLTVTDTGNISTSAGYGIFAPTAWTIQNAGTIYGYNGGIYIEQASAVTNHAGGMIAGSDAIIFGHGGTLANQAGGVVKGNHRDGVFAGGDASVVNAGDISGHTAGVYVRYGDGQVTNTGTISGVKYGVWLFAGTGTDAGLAGTVENAGTIIGSGGTAVLMSEYESNRLIVDPGAVFSGIVDASVATATNAIELKSGAVEGTLSGLGSEYVGFQSVTIDSGATWDIAGSASGFAGVTVAGFGLGDTIEIDDVAYAAGDTATLGGSDLLTVYNAGGTSLAAVQLAGSFENDGFTVSDDNGHLQVTDGVAKITGTHAGGIVLTAAAYTNPVTITSAAYVSGNYNSGRNGGALIATSAWTIDNAGSVIGGGFGQDGINLKAGGSVTNEASGTIYGVDGIAVHGAGTVENAGTISGLDASVLFYSATGNRLIIDAGAVFYSAVYVFHGTANTIELTGKTGAGTLYGLGKYTEYSGFNTVTIDTGATWDIGASVSGFTGVTVDGLNGNDTLDLTDLKFNAGDSATLNGSDQLVIGDPGGNVTIQLDAGAGGAPFTLASDGRAGTDIKVVPVVSAGTTVSGLLLTSGTSVVVSSGGTAVKDSVQPGGTQTVRSGGVASATAISGGTEMVSSGGRSIGAVVSSGGTEKVLAGGTASGLTVKTGGVLTVSSGGVASGAALSGGAATILGTASAGTILAGGSLTVSAGGKAIGATVSSGGTEKVLSSGAASAAAVKAGGSLTVSASGSASGAVLSGGSDTVLGTASATTILTGGTETVSGGGKSIGVIVSNGGTEKVLTGGAASGIAVKSGGTLVYGGGTVTGATVSSGGKEAVTSGVAVSGLAVGSGVTLTVSSGGTASKPTVAAGGVIADLGHTLSATVKGTVAGAKVTSGLETVSAKAIASATTVDTGGVLIVSSGGTAIGTTLSGGTENVLSGGVISGAVTFKATGDTLSITGTKPTALTVSGFVKTDTIDLASFASKNAKLSFVEAKAKTSGTLTITDGTLKASVTLFGNYVAAGFKLSADGAGTAITYTSATAAHEGLAVSHT